LLNFLPAARLLKYEAICGKDSHSVEKLYMYNHELSMAIFSDIAFLEVIMRSSMAAQLRSQLGVDWYQSKEHFDDRSMENIEKAIAKSGITKGNFEPLVAHGKVVSSFTFGFWVGLLGRGGYQNDNVEKDIYPNGRRMFYDEILWKPALANAFPFAPAGHRRSIERHARSVNLMRNRIAHHEPIIFGIPQDGAYGRNGSINRKSVKDSWSDLSALSKYIQVDFAEWLKSNSKVDLLIGNRPVSHEALLID